MVEKIDRPEAHQPYQITRAKDAKEDQHHQHNPREEMEKEYKRQLEGKEWSKFGQRARTIKPIRVEKEKIARCLFKAVNLHSGVGILQVDVIWKDGRVTRDALMLITRLEDFMKTRKLLQGQLVPEDIWARGPTVEIGIVQTITESGAFPSKEYGTTEQKQAPLQKISFLERIGLVSSKPRKINFGFVILYAFLLGLIVLAIMALIKHQ